MEERGGLVTSVVATSEVTVVFDGKFAGESMPSEL